MLRLRLVFLVAAAAALAGWTRPSRVRPDFSGEWTLSKERSHFELAAARTIERGVVRIEHREPHFRFERTFTVGGAEDRVAYEMTADSSEVVSREGALTSRSRLYWVGDTLVYETRMVAPGGEATNVVRCSLLDGGSALRAMERFRGPRLSYDNLWVFERR
jgi:hypothetical protein